MMGVRVTLAPRSRLFLFVYKVLAGATAGILY